MSWRSIAVAAALVVAWTSLIARADTLSVPSEYPTVATAAIAAVDGDVIEVAPGTHFVTSVLLNKQVSLVSTGGPAVTTLRPSSPNRILVCNALGPDVVIDGFTFLDGFVSNQPGAGMFCLGSTLTIRDCVFRSNESTGGSAASDGGAIALGDSDATLIDCDFIANSAQDGGAVACMGSNPMFIGCRFFGNIAGGNGGAVHLEQDSLPFLLNCLFSGNTADFGGAIYGLGLFDRPQIVAHCTFSGNAATVALVGGAIAFGVGGGFQTPVRNSILWGNAPNQYGGDNTTASFAYTIIGQVLFPPGIGTINANPLFVDANGADNIVGTEDDNLRVTLGSPAIDSAAPGVALFAWYCLGTDLDGNARYYDHPMSPTTVSPYDRGAYEFGAGPPTIDDCNANTLDDFCECNVSGLWPLLAVDCNNNDVPDECDVALGGGSADANGNGVPDECEFGRCCLDDGSCVEEFVQECAADGGVYGGPGSICNIVCPQPGACCFDDGSCQVTVASECTSLGGSFQGQGVACGGCPQPGACCFDDGSCVVVGPAACAVDGGDFEGHGTGCEICPEPGACCYLDGTCDDLTAGACAVTDGLFHGRGTSCILTDCPVPGSVLGTSKISDTQGGFDGVLQDFDGFGAVTSIGDLDGDGVLDLAVGAPGDNHGAGAVWVLFMNADGTVESEQEISAASGGGGPVVGGGFGSSVACLGDRDGDGTTDLVVGAPYVTGQTYPLGAAWLVHLDTDGTIASSSLVMTGVDEHIDSVGAAVAAIGDVDGDGVQDFAISNPTANAGWVSIELSAGSGHVVVEADIPGLESGDYFGSSIAGLGDLDGDGVPDIAIGASGDDDGGLDRGAVWIVLLNADASVKDSQKISDTVGGFTGVLANSDRFGTALAKVGDLDLDGVPDIAVSATADTGAMGAVWILFLAADGSVVAHRKIASGAGGFPNGQLASGDYFGGPVASVGDFDGDGHSDLAVGATGDDDGGTNRGAVWLLKLDGVTTINFDLALEFLAAGAGDFVAPGDLDTDGDEDAVIVIPGTNPLIEGHVQVFLNQGTDGNGGWLGLVAQPAIEVGLQPSGVAVGHFDLDGHLDLAVTNAGDANVSILLNTGLGTGTFAFDQSIAVGLEPQAIASFDLNGSAPDDLAVANAASDTVMLITNVTALAGASSWMVTATIPVGGMPTALEPEDVDNDKDFDLVVANRGSGTIDFLLLEAGGPGTIETVNVGASPIDVSTGDLDGNGFADAGVALEGDDAIALIPNEGGGTFGAPESIPVGESPESVDVVDLDDDGDPDLAAVAGDPVIGPAVRVLENFGPSGGPAIAVFGTPLGFAVGADPNYVVSADFDEDSRTDLATANDDPAGPTGGSVSVLLNLACPADTDGTGDAGFADLTNILLNWGPCPSPPANCPWDLDRNGTVGFNDLTHLLIGWGSCN